MQSTLPTTRNEDAVRGDLPPTLSPRRSKIPAGVVKDSEEAWYREAVASDPTSLSLEKLNINTNHFTGTFIINVTAPGVSPETRDASEEFQHLVQSSRDVPRLYRAGMFRDYLERLAARSANVDKGFLAKLDIFVALVDPETGRAAISLSKASEISGGNIQSVSLLPTPPRLDLGQTPTFEAPMLQLRSVAATIFSILSRVAQVSSESITDSIQKLTADLHKLLQNQPAVQPNCVPVAVRHEVGVVLEQLSQRAFEDGQSSVAIAVVRSAETYIRDALNLACSLNVSMAVNDDDRAEWQCLEHHLITAAYLNLCYTLDEALSMDPCSEEATNHLDGVCKLLSDLNRTVRAQDRFGSRLISMGTQKLLCAQLRILRQDPEITKQTLRQVAVGIRERSKLNEGSLGELFAAASSNFVPGPSVHQSIQSTALGEMLLGLLQFGDSDTIDTEMKNYQRLFHDFIDNDRFDRDRNMYFEDAPHLELLSRMCLKAFDDAELDRSKMNRAQSLQFRVWGIVALSTIGDLSGTKVEQTMKFRLIQCNFNDITSAINTKSAKWTFIAPVLARWLAPYRETLRPELLAILPLA